MSIPRTLAPYDPFAATGGGSIANEPFIVGPLPSGDVTGAQDTAAIQNFINTYSVQGITTTLIEGTYYVTSLTLPAGAHGLVLAGVPGKYDVPTQGTRIKTVGSGIPLVTDGCYKCAVYGIIFDANRTANYAVSENGFTWGFWTNCGFANGLLDGCHAGPAPRLNDTNTFTGCFFTGNGTIFASAGAMASYVSGAQKTQINGTATTAAGNGTITIVAGTDLTTLGVRAGDLLRVHSNPVQLIQIASVTPTTIIADVNSNNLASVNGAGFDFALLCGAGYYEERNANNNLNVFDQCVTRTNAMGYRFDGLSGNTVNGGQADFNGIGFVVSRADNATAYVGLRISMVFHEANDIGVYFLGQSQNAVIESMNDEASATFPSPIQVSDCIIIRQGRIESLAWGVEQNLVINVQCTAGGVVQHQMCSDWIAGVGVGSDIDRISNPTFAFTNTPFVDNVTNFAAGAGVLASAHNVLLVDNVNQQAAFGVVKAFALLESNTTGISYRIVPTVVSAAVNGRTIRRFGLRLMNGDVQTDWVAGPANIPVGTHLAIRVQALMR